MRELARLISIQLTIPAISDPGAAIDGERASGAGGR